MPKRCFDTVDEFEVHLGDTSELLFDGTEMHCERPEGKEGQRAKFSGKRKAHTDLALVLSDRSTWIHYVSRLYEGSNVDFSVLKQEFQPGKEWFEKFKVIVDLGFVGIAKEFEIKKLVIGIKKPRKSKNNPNPELTEEQKEWNKKVGRARIHVEHAIGRMKIFRILKNKCRMKSNEMKNRIIGVCAGLWNYKIAT